MSLTLTDYLAIWAAVFVTIRMLWKWGWSRRAIYTNYRRMMAQRTELRMKYKMDPVSLEALTENAENMRVAMERLTPWPAESLMRRCRRRQTASAMSRADGCWSMCSSWDINDFTCPWGDQCMYNDHHKALQDGTFQYGSNYQDYIQNILQNSAIELVIGKVSNATDEDKKRLNWVRHVLAVCDAHERRVNETIEARENAEPLKRSTTDSTTTLGHSADEKHLLIF